MELKEGYKNTEIGVIPENWEVISFDKAFYFLSTASYSRAEISKDADIKYVHYGDIHTKLEHFLDFKHFELPTIKNEQLITYSLIKEGDLIMADASEDYEGIGKSVEVRNIGNNKAISGLHTFLLRGKEGVFSNEFKAYLHSNKIIKTQYDKLATGLKVYGVSKGNLKQIQIPLPPLPEQTAIATVLSDTDSLIQTLEKKIAKKQLIKKGAMQKLLTPKEGWERVPLNKVIDVNRGGSPRPIQNYITSSPKGINWIKIGDTSPESKYITSSKEKIITEGVQHSRTVNVGDFLLSNSMSFGRPYILKIDGCIHDGWLVLQNYQSSFDREFLYYTLMSEDVYNQYMAKASGSGVLNLNKELVKTVELNKPKDLKEQTHIAQILSDIDCEIESLQKGLAKYKHLKQGLMQNLLTGKIRLV